MADIALDYGSADADPTSVAPMQDDAMDDDSQSRQQQQQGSRFYAMPADQAVEAGAQRGPTPLPSAEINLDDAALVGSGPPSEAPDPPAVEGGSDIRLETLLIEGLPITQLSTSRLFAYLTHFGAQPLGLEWIDDQRCKIVFADERSARLGLEYLLPAPSADNEMQPADDQITPLPNIDTLLEYEPDSWHSEFITSLVTPRKAHRIPAKLYNHVERQAAATELEEQNRIQDAVSSLPDDVPEIYRELEEADRRGKLESREVRDLHKLRSALWLRHAVTDVDRKESRASTRSQWYKRHGYEAGREIVPKLLQVGEVRESIELFPDYKPQEQGREARRRDDRRRMEELDSKLDQYLHSRDPEPERKAGEMMADAVQARRRDGGDLMDRLSSRRSGGDRRHSRRTDEDRWTHDAYDSLNNDSHPPRGGRRSHRRAEASEDRYRRELSPTRTSGDGRVKVKGRGRMKAPGGFNDRWEEKGNLADRINSSLKDRLGGSNSLADRFS
ncbi:uncharacterized protein SPSC_05146 [Sporisorium scitamineum]|uniref:Uncharacterized protein n=1 Tax=Sporisorium scitamineum TaxID=49012 RepID=A0A0F7S2A5_9BASI|nr:hypothetical protein [Sporisorium scitamineum]CDU25312.1 uncharacterized protein SPSC_05146 [Sporisorium scitamineum]